jgi:predicted alpha/beta hydrolase
MTDWASNHETEYRALAITVGKDLKTVATCATGYAATDQPCPEMQEGAHWNRNPDLFPDTARIGDGKHHPVQKYDPDIRSMTADDEPWLRACLTDPDYPPPSSK